MPPTPPPITSDMWLVINRLAQEERVRLGSRSVDSAEERARSTIPSLSLQIYLDHLDLLSAYVPPGVP